MQVLGLRNSGVAYYGSLEIVTDDVGVKNKSILQNKTVMFIHFFFIFFFKEM